MSKRSVHGDLKVQSDLQYYIARYCGSSVGDAKFWTEAIFQCIFLALSEGKDINIGGLFSITHVNAKFRNFHTGKMDMQHSLRFHVSRKLKNFVRSMPLVEDCVAKYDIQFEDE